MDDTRAPLRRGGARARLPPRRRGRRHRRQPRQPGPLLVREPDDGRPRARAGAAARDAASSSSPAPSAPTRNSRPCRSTRTTSGTATPRRRTLRTASPRRRSSSAPRPTASSTGSNTIFLLPTNLYGPRDNFDLDELACDPRPDPEDDRVAATRSSSGATARRRASTSTSTTASKGSCSPRSATTGPSRSTSAPASRRRSARRPPSSPTRSGSTARSAWDTSMPNGQPRRSLDAVAGGGAVRLRGARHRSRRASGAPWRGTATAAEPLRARLTGSSSSPSAPSGSSPAGSGARLRLTHGVSSSATPRSPRATDRSQRTASRTARCRRRRAGLRLCCSRRITSVTPHVSHGRVDPRRLSTSSSSLRSRPTACSMSPAESPGGPTRSRPPPSGCSLPIVAVPLFVPKYHDTYVDRRAPAPSTGSRSSPPTSRWCSRSSPRSSALRAATGARRAAASPRASPPPRRSRVFPVSRRSRRRDRARTRRRPSLPRAGEALARRRSRPRADADLARIAPSPTTSSRSAARAGTASSRRWLRSGSSSGRTGCSSGSPSRGRSGCSGSATSGAALSAGWVATATVLVRRDSQRSSIEAGSSSTWLPAWPAYALLVAAIPALVPTLACGSETVGASRVPARTACRRVLEPLTPEAAAASASVLRRAWSSRCSSSASAAPAACS